MHNSPKDASHHTWFHLDPDFALKQPVKHDGHSRQQCEEWAKCPQHRTPTEEKP